MTECLTDRIDLYLESLPPPTGRTFHQMQPETLLSECRTTIDLQASVIIGYQNDLQKLEKAYAQQQQVWSDAIARADRYEAALRKIAQHDMQAIALDALRPGERVPLAGEKKK
jgi:hypothetical protein